MNADATGTGKSQLTNNSGSAIDDESPVFSPDGSTIAFTRYTGGGSPEIWLMNADGSNQRSLTAGEFPSYSPDGTKIAYQKLVGGKYQPYVISALGGG